LRPSTSCSSAARPERGQPRRAVHAVVSYAEVDAILRYRAEVGVIRDPAEPQVINGVIGEDKPADRGVSGPARQLGKSTAASSSLKAQTQWSPATVPRPCQRPRPCPARDTAAPRIRRRHRHPHPAGRGSDPNRSASRPSDRQRRRTPKAYAMWETEHVSLVAGNYRSVGEADIRHHPAGHPTVSTPMTAFASAQTRSTRAGSRAASSARSRVTEVDGEISRRLPLERAMLGGGAG
jgi:hypothetical protein